MSGMTFPALCLTPERLTKESSQSLGASLSCVFQFFVAQVLMGLRKQFINNSVFPTWTCVAGFNNNNMRKI